MEEGSSGRWVVICRGLTGSSAKPSAIDKLADFLGRKGFSTLRFDFRRSLDPPRGSDVRTIDSMIEDFKAAVEIATELSSGKVHAVVARGLGSRVALQALVPRPDLPIIMWAPILWPRTSLEVRLRLHQIRRHGFTGFDDTRFTQVFVDALADPTDGELMSWLLPERDTIVIYPTKDKVVPLELYKETIALISSAGVKVKAFAVEGEHPHPEVVVELQLAAIGDALVNLR